MSLAIETGNRCEAEACQKNRFEVEPDWRGGRLGFHHAALRTVPKSVAQFTLSIETEMYSPGVKLPLEKITVLLPSVLPCHWLGDLRLSPSTSTSTLWPTIPPLISSEIDF